MAAPRDIVDVLECVLSVYFSNVRHRHRAAFLLADELVEMTCKAKARQATPTLGAIKFVPLLRLPAVNLNPTTSTLGETLRQNHNTRNSMQHENAAFTVDDQHCADAILDAVEAVEHCFQGACAVLPEPLRVTLRVVRLLSSRGYPAHRDAFDFLMRNHPWRGNRERARVNETIVSPGQRGSWGLVIMTEYATIESILSRIGVP
jgi:hypothetical protein